MVVFPAAFITPPVDRTCHAMPRPIEQRAEDVGEPVREWFSTIRERMHAARCYAHISRLIACSLSAARTRVLLYLRYHYRYFDTELKRLYLLSPMLLPPSRRVSRREPPYEASKLLLVNDATQIIFPHAILISATTGLLCFAKDLFYASLALSSRNATSTPWRFAYAISLPLIRRWISR